MADDRQEIIDINSLPDGEGILPMSWSELTFEDIYTDRRIQLFQKGIPRACRISYMACSKFEKAIRIILETYTDIPPADLEYLLIMAGREKLKEKYNRTAGAIRTLITTLDHDPNFKGTIESLHPMRIEQTGGNIHRKKISVTFPDGDDIEDEAEFYGVSMYGYVIVCFWLCVLSDDNITPDLKKYGKAIVDEFEQKLKMRLGMLELLRNTYS